MLSAERTVEHINVDFSTAFLNSILRKQYTFQGKNIVFVFKSAEFWRRLL